ncbi:MAG: class I SAM-dependent methyltransferase [Sporolactobacillus sp.]
MDDHYYSAHPQSTSARQLLHAELRGLPFTFITDAGVFSKSGLDFGTRLLIESFHEPTVDGAILDMGCGYGPIGISVGKLCKSRRIVMTDVNERAAQLAAENALANHVAAEVKCGFLFEKVSGDYAAIISNPPIRAGKKVVHQIFSDSYRFLKPGGMFWTVIQKKQGAPSAQKALEALFGQVEVQAKKKGYYIFCAKKV